jgi:hypothetical protein
MLNLLLAVLEDNFTAATMQELSHEQMNDASTNDYPVLSIVLGIANRAKRAAKRWLARTCNEHPRVMLAREQLRRFLGTALFANVITLMILTNTIVLCLDHYPSSESFDQSLDLCNFIFMLGFIVEMLLKLFALGPMKYLSSYEDAFDGALAICSIAATIVSTPALLTGHQSTFHAGGISALRSFRLFRIFKLAQR